MAELMILPAIYYGIIVGIYEAILLHRDVKIPSHRFGHMIHALVIAIIAVFATMNVEYVLGLIPAIQNIPLLSNVLVFQIAIGLIVMIKIHTVSAAVPRMQGGNVGLKEKWSHSFLVAVLIVVAPYVWPFLAPLVSQWLPGI